MNPALIRFLTKCLLLNIDLSQCLPVPLSASFPVAVQVKMMVLDAESESSKLRSVIGSGGMSSVIKVISVPCNKSYICTFSCISV